MTDAAYNALVAELAKMPHVIDRLLAEHVPDPQGWCRSCTQPGTGYPAAVHPCAMHQLATAATEHWTGER